VITRLFTGPLLTRWSSIFLLLLGSFEFFFPHEPQITHGVMQLTHMQLTYPQLMNMK
jgi:hypothetical protein